MRPALAACRAATLARTADLDDAALRAQPDPDFSPIGWHLGHIAYTEALWLAPGADPHPEWQTLFRQDGMPKAARRQLPSHAALEDYLAAVRSLVLARLDGEPEAALPLWRFILQHEAQHTETIAVVRHLNGLGGMAAGHRLAAADEAAIAIPAGTLRQGNDGAEALDNERPAHGVALPGFRLSRRPVSERQYLAFMAAGGYRDDRLWSAEGLAWRSTAGSERPRHWHGGAGWLPVHGINAYEAEAYCRFAGGRLPSEAEWERAAGLHPEWGFLGEVWQWTSSPFAPYAGFAAFPYDGYSAAYFDDRHRVLKGGSWATLPAALRASFRNWYPPATRQIFAGFRYATSL
ncbi:MAG: SUMF1/EgtB/PvdO family nonheme iron enzyme [Alphaproteobacteria bacterium]